MTINTVTRDEIQHCENFIDTLIRLDPTSVAALGGGRCVLNLMAQAETSNPQLFNTITTPGAVNFYLLKNTHLRALWLGIASRQPELLEDYLYCVSSHVEELLVELGRDPITTLNGVGEAVVSNTLLSTDTMTPI